MSRPVLAPTQYREPLPQNPDLVLPIAPKIVRCADCKFWDLELDSVYGDKVGTCQLQFKRDNPGMWTSCGENTIETDHDFGCVQGKARGTA